MADGIDALSKLTRLSREEVIEAWEKVKANRAILDACPGPHVFKAIDKRTERCDVCGGEINTINAQWYRTGLDHGAVNRKHDGGADRDVSSL